MPTLNHRAIYEQLVADIKAAFPKLAIRFKDESRFMRALGWFLVRIVRLRAFMTDYTTTIGPTIYLDTEARAEIAAGLHPWRTIAHEYVHVRQDARHPPRGLWYKFTYLFPLPLGLFALGALLAIPLSTWHLLWLVALVAFAPLPAPGRVYWEREAYRISMLCDVLAHGKNYVLGNSYQAFMVRHYTGSDYYFMSWRRRAIVAMVLEDTQRAIKLAEGILVRTDFEGRIIEIVRTAGAIPTLRPAA